MSESKKNFNLTRRKFVAVSSAAIAAPFVMKMTGTVPDVEAAEKKGMKKEMSLEQKVQQVLDFQEIQNIMGRYAYLTMASDKERRYTLFAEKAEGVRVYFGQEGYFEGVGQDPPKRAWGSMGDLNEPKVGSMSIHAPICPVIEIAEDGQTAKGIWMGLGLLAMKDRETGEPTGAWEWDKYGVDFIKEDGVWKILHFHIYRLLHGWGVDEKWAEQFSKLEGGMGIKTDGPCPEGDDNPYRPDTVQRLVPKIPEPYETFDPNDIY